MKIDKAWFPFLNDPGQLYLRLCHISTDEVMGVKTPSSSKIFGMLNPTTLRSKNLALKCSDGATKNWPLGHGQYTLSGNLGALIPYVADAKRNGFDDVLWLLDDYVQELTILNIFFVYKDRYGQLILSTPLDNGCILPNTIRNSILEMSSKIEEETGLSVKERYISIHEVLNAHKEGRLIEVIGCSTSSFLQPVNKITYKDQTIKLRTSKDSEYVSYLRNILTEVMVGPDSHEWVTSLED